MTELPTGTVTFLFTDIEGSTRRWEEQPQAMRAALAQHDALLREAIESHGGYVFKTMGDAFCAAFAAAADALAAAIAAQRALRAEPWEKIGSLCVRTALHTGAAELRDGDYFGPALNRVARLLAAGHGGQVLLSAVVQELVSDQLSPGVALRDLGQHRLRDLQRPQRVFQLILPDLPADFPPLRTLDTRANNLPAQATPLIGRQKEAAAACAALLRPDVRLLTLTGPGGIGKTRLALQVAADALDEFEGGAFFVPLAATTEAALVAPAITRALGVHESGDRPLLESLMGYLRDRRVLLVLDNFEQVIEAAPVVADLLAACAQLKVLVTSREVLSIYAEHEFRVPPMALPERTRLPPIGELSQYDAVRLFILRAQAVKREFAITAENAPAVAEICRRLDGLPLAIELAAARVRTLPPQAILARLERRLALLTGGPRDLPARQQTLRGAIAWSYDLLVPREQVLFRRLAVFAGGGTLEASEAVCNADGFMERDVLDEVETLVTKSLLRQEEVPGGELRFVMLETIREYALEQQALRGEAETLHAQHAAYYLALAEQAEPMLTGPEQVAWLNRLDQEHDNLRGALRWLADHERPEEALRLAGALWRFWSVHGHLSEGRQRLERLLTSRAAAVRTAALAKALNGAGTLAAEQLDNAAARRWYEESLAIWRELDDTWGIAASLNNLGILAMQSGDYAAAQALYEESLAIKRELGDRPGIARSLNNLGIVVQGQGDYAAARALYEESLAIRRELGDKWGIANALNALGDVAREQGGFAAARVFYTEGLALQVELGDKAHIASALEDFACLAAVEDHPVLVLRLGATAAALREALGVPAPHWQAEVEPSLAEARQALGEAEAAAAWAEGQAMTLGQAIACALEEPAPLPLPDAQPLAR